MQSYKFSDMAAELGATQPVDEDDRRIAGYLDGRRHEGTTHSQRALHHEVYSIVDRLLDSKEMGDKIQEAVEFGDRMAEVLVNHMITSPEFEAKIVELMQNTFSREMERTNQAVVSAVKAVMDTKSPQTGGNTFNERRADKLTVPDFAGKHDKEGFGAFADMIKNWAQALYKKGLEHMEGVEDPEVSVEEYISECGDENVKEFGERLHEKLISACKGDARAYAKDRARNGLASWQRLAREYDPREQLDKSVAYELVARPKPSRNLDDARVKLQAWWNDTVDYDAKFPNSFSDDAKILAIRTLVPRALTGNAFVAKRYDDPRKFYKDIHDFVSERTFGEVAKVQREPVDQVMEVGSAAHETLENMVMAIVKGKGKGQGFGMKNFKGNGKGAGEKGSKGGGYGKPKGQDKGAGKGKVTCWSCGKEGHKSFECWSKGSGLHEFRDEGHEVEEETMELENEGWNHDQICMLCSVPERQGCSAYGVDPKVATQNSFQALAEREDEIENPSRCVNFVDLHDVESNKKKQHMRKVTNRKDWKLMSLGPDWEKEKPKEECNQVNSLEDFDDVLRSVICEVGNPEKKGEASMWEKIEAAVDSAAVDCVMPWQILPHIRTVPSDRSRTGRHYVAANNQEIKNRGQRKIRFTTEEGQTKTIGFQSAEVSRTLISVDKLNEAGCEVVLNKRNPRIITTKGEVIKLRRKGGVFVLNMWIKLPGPCEPGQGAANTNDKTASEVIAPVFARQAR